MIVKKASKKTNGNNHGLKDVQLAEVVDKYVQTVHYPKDVVIRRLLEEEKMIEKKHHKVELLINESEQMSGKLQSDIERLHKTTVEKIQDLRNRLKS